MFLALVWKKRSATMPSFLDLTPAFSRPRSEAGSEPVATTMQSTLTIFSWPPVEKMTVLILPFCETATTLELVMTITPSLLVR